MGYLFNKNCLTAWKIIIGSSAIMLLWDIHVTDVLSIIVIAFEVFFFTIESKNKTQRVKWIAHSVAVVLAIFCVLIGSQKIHGYNLNLVEKVLTISIIFFGVEVNFNYFLLLFYTRAFSLRVSGDYLRSKGTFYKAYLFLLVCQIPVFLCFFPGCVTSDSTTQILQAISGRYSNHHPVLQTWFIKGVYQITSHFTGDLNAMVAAFIAIQELCMMAIYAYVIYTLYEYHSPKWIRRVVLIYYALMPYNLMMADNMWKDSFFSAGLLLFALCIWRINKKERLRDLVLLFIAGIIVCMYRNNGWYAFVGTLPFALVTYWRGKKRMCIVLLGVVALALLIRGPMFKALGVEEPSFAESLSIPAQQIANTITQKARLTEEERKTLLNIIDIDKIPGAYDAHVSDPIKSLLNNKGQLDYLRKNKEKYLAIWLKLGMRYPGFYLQAFVNQTEGYYNPNIQRWQYTQGVWDTQMPIYNTALLPSPFCNAIKWYVGDWLYRIPALGMLKSIGFFVWALFILLGLCLSKKKYENLLLFILLIFYWLTLIIATPVYDEFRYIYGLFICMPVLMVSTLIESTDNTNI